MSRRTPWSSTASRTSQSDRVLRRGSDWRRCTRSVTWSSPRTGSRESRSPNWSTRSSRLGASTATNTPTCRTTARPGGSRSPVSTTAPPRCTAEGVRRLRARGPGRDRRRSRRGPTRGRAVGALNVERAWSVCTRMMLEAFYSHPGRGTRSASVVRHTRGDTCGSGPDRDPPSRTSVPERPMRIPSRAAKELGGGTWTNIPKGSRGPAENDSRLPARCPPPRPSGRHSMRALLRRARRSTSLIVGAGAGGSVLAQRLARRGWRIVILEAGPVLGSRPGLGLRRGGLASALLDTTKRIIDGDDPIELGKNNSGRGVGGSMVHYAGYTPRFHPSDFETFTPRRSRRGLADLLPGSEAPLRASRARAPRRRPKLALGDPHGYPFRHTRSAALLRPLAGRSRPGIEMRAGPVGIVNGTFGNRPHCIYRGFCLQGCKVNAKASALVTHLPDALAHGVEIRADSHGDPRSSSTRPAGPPASPISRRRGVERFQRAAGGRSLRATRSRLPGCC